MLSFNRAKGLYGGLTLEGAIVATQRALNRAYYGKEDVTTMDILVRQNVSHPDAENLRRAVAGLGH